MYFFYFVNSRIVKKIPENFTKLKKNNIFFSEFSKTITGKL